MSDEFVNTQIDTENVSLESFEYDEHNEDQKDENKKIANIWNCLVWRVYLQFSLYMFSENGWESRIYQQPQPNN